MQRFIKSVQGASVDNRSGLLTSCLLMFLAGCFLCFPAWGRQFQGGITGVVTDPNGSLIPGAQVTVAEQGTGFSRSSRALQDGSYDIPLSLPGRKHVEAAKGG